MAKEVNGYRVILADDEPSIVRLLSRVLRQEKYELFCAYDGEEALRLLSHDQIACVLCDYQMPRVDGIEVLRQAAELHPFAGRILLTGHGDRDTVIKAVNVGQVNQYLLKPWDESDLRARVRHAVEHYAVLAENARLEKVNAQQHEALEVAHTALQAEVEIGAKIQEVMLRGKPPLNCEEARIAAVSLPSKQIDGDFFQFFCPSKGLLDLVLGDVMGKGIPAALVGSATKAQLHRFASMNTSSRHFSTEEGGWRMDLLEPWQIVQRTQEEIGAQLMELGFFVTLIYGRFDFEKGLFTFVDSGATKPFYFSATEQRWRILEGDNVPLGVSAEEQYRQSRVAIAGGDCFLFYSDGLTEARNEAGELFGIERLHNLVEEIADRSAEEMVEAIRFAVREFCRDEALLADDLTCLVIQISESAASWIPIRAERAFDPKLGELSAVRGFIESACSYFPALNQTTSQVLQLAVDEAFANIVRHGLVGQSSEKIEVAVERSTRAVLIEIRDRGAPMDYSALYRPDFSGAKEGGFGLYIIGSIADEVTYLPSRGEGECNRLRIVKFCGEGGADMQISHEIQNGVLIIKLKSEDLDAASAKDFKEQVLSAITNQEIRRVVFNLDKLQFIDSSGLGSFLSILRFLNSNQGDLKLACMAGPVCTMFQIVRMHKLFEIYNSQAEAIESFVEKAEVEQ